MIRIRTSHCAALLLALGSLTMQATEPELPSAKDARIKASEALADSLLPALPPKQMGVTEQDISPPGEYEMGPPAEAAPPKPKEKPVANLFIIPGPAAVMQARAAGYHFSPAGGTGNRNGIHTTAFQYPNTITSEVDGVSMREYRPNGGWAIAAISNKFYMFVESNLRPAPLAAGWKIRDIKLKGTNWQWAGGPQSGAPSASFAITITAPKFGPPANEVILESISLEGPPGETNWRKAFASEFVAVTK